jgi:PKD repeat protein
LILNILRGELRERDMTIPKKIHIQYLLLVVVIVASTFLSQPVQVQAQGDWRDSSADIDGDGLPNQVEDNGWYNASGGPYSTDYLDTDSDDDGLTDGKEKLYDTNPLDSRSPGIFVDYRSDLQTSQYFPWQRFGSRYVALPISGEDSVVVRRGSTFSVGGPAGAQLSIDPSLGSLTPLTAERNPCSGLWEVYVPEDGTVGIYSITMQDGGWSQSLNLYVIFELPTGMSDSFVGAFVYDDHWDWPYDTTSVGYFEGLTGGHVEYDSSDYSWIPDGEWVNHGYVWNFQTQHHSDFVFEDHVMPIINGYTNTWDAANALVQHVDDVTCFGSPRPLSDSWCVLNPGQCWPNTNENQCTNIANLFVAFNRAAGIPSRPVWTDWLHSTFDHSTEVWTKGPWYGVWDWYIAQGYASDEYGITGGCPSYGYSGGYSPLSGTLGWYDSPGTQGVYAAGELWTWNDMDGGGSPEFDDFRQSSWDDSTIVKKSWLETRFVDYWGWPSEPDVVGSPPSAWPPLPSSPPVADFSATPTSGPAPLEVSFSDESTGHVSSWAWDFGDGGTSTQRNPSHMYDNPGNYKVKLTVEGSGGTDSKVRNNYINVQNSLSGLEVSTASEGSGIEIGPVVADHGVDEDGDGRYDRLVFEIEVNAQQAGDYWIQGLLGGDYNVPVGGSAIEEIVPIRLARGSQTVALSFEGKDLYSYRANGPFYLHGVSITDVTNPTKSDFAEQALAYAVPEYTTSGYSYDDFGRLGARLTGEYSPSVSDKDGDGWADTLVVETGLNIERADTYAVQGMLYDGQDKMLSKANWSGTGPQVRLEFEGLRDTEGPYSLKHLHVRDSLQEVTDGIKEPYDLGELPELSAKPMYLGAEADVSAEIGATFVITDGYSDKRLDTDGDGQYDQLVIATTVEVEPGEGGQAYRIEGWLVDQNNDLISWASSDAQVLNEGLNVLSLAFDGRIIHQHGVDGPYTLIALKALPGNTYDVLNEVDVAYTTSAYGSGAFEEPVVASGTVEGLFVDNMENGTAQWTTAGSAWNLGDSEWASFNHAWEASVSGSDGSLLTTIPFDLSDYGGSDLTVGFKTCYAISGGDSGRLEISPNGVDWALVATYTDTTSNWSAWAETISLDTFDNVENLQLRFGVESQNGLLWYIDDVYVGAPNKDGVYLPMLFR